jgi:hypothetical protein
MPSAYAIRICATHHAQAMHNAYAATQCTYVLTYEELLLP